ncbi:hypothetical protein JCM11641_002529 [Rhodosporidiobolus odoratus]
MTAAVHSQPSSPSSFYGSPSSFNLPPRPQPQRRPSALRTRSSDHILTPAVLRFNPRAEAIPRRSHSSPKASPRSLSTPVPSRPAPPIPSPSSLEVKAPLPPVRPSPHPLTTASASSGSSLLARRRSSRSAGTRSDALPLLSDLMINELPPSTPEELDDTVRPEVIGESLAAKTPCGDAASPNQTEQVVTMPCQSTKRVFVPTPFRRRGQGWLSDEDEDEDEEEEEKKTASSAVSPQ